MTNPTPHGQVPEALRLADELVIPIEDYPEATALERNAAAELRRLHAENEALRAGVTSEQRRLIGVIADKIEDGTLFQSGIYQKKDLARFVRNMLDTTPTAPAASPTPPVEQQATPKAAPGEPVHGDVLPPVGSRVYIRHGRDNGAHACTVVKDAAFEAVRKKLCALPRYSFVLVDDGLVRRAPDRTGNWIEFDEAHALFDPVSVDAAIAAQGGK